MAGNSDSSPLILSEATLDATERYINDLCSAHNLPPFRLRGSDYYNADDRSFDLHALLNDESFLRTGTPIPLSHQISLIEKINRAESLTLSRWGDSPYVNNTPAQTVIDDAVNDFSSGSLNLENLPVPSGEKVVVVLDLGHGDDTANDGVTIIEPGATYAGVSEIIVVDPVAIQIQKALESQGVEVVFTRYPGEYIIDDRAYMDINGGAAEGSEYLDWRVASTNALISVGYTPVFVSLHANAGEGRGSDVFYNTLSSASAELAEAIDGTFTLDPEHDNDVKSAEFAVLQNQQPETPSVLIELGYLDNEAERHTLANLGDNPNIAGLPIAEGILNFLDSRYPNRTLEAIVDEPSSEIESTEMIVEKDILKGLNEAMEDLTEGRLTENAPAPDTDTDTDLTLPPESRQIVAEAAAAIHAFVGDEGHDEHEGDKEREFELADGDHVDLMSAIVALAGEIGKCDTQALAYDTPYIEVDAEHIVHIMSGLKDLGIHYEDVADIVNHADAGITTEQLMQQLEHKIATQGQDSGPSL